MFLCIFIFHRILKVDVFYKTKMQMTLTSIKAWITLPDKLVSWQSSDSPLACIETSTG